MVVKIYSFQDWKKSFPSCSAPSPSPCVSDMPGWCVLMVPEPRAFCIFRNAPGASSTITFSEDFSFSGRSSVCDDDWESVCVSPTVRAFRSVLSAYFPLLWLGVLDREACEDVCRSARLWLHSCRYNVEVVSAEVLKGGASWS